MHFRLHRLDARQSLTVGCSKTPWSIYFYYSQQINLNIDDLNTSGGVSGYSPSVLPNVGFKRIKRLKMCKLPSDQFFCEAGAVLTAAEQKDLPYVIQFMQSDLSNIDL